MFRTISPEILDQLPHDDPAARHSRRDLRWINFFMGNNRWLKRHLQLLPPGECIVELGSGEGAMAQIMAGPATFANWIACDLAPPPETWPASWQWRQGDLFTTLPELAGTVAIGNLILHHFTDLQLQNLGGLLAEYDRLIFSEPLRRPRVLVLSRLAELMWIHKVTRHDMRVSIKAGFVGTELPVLLGLQPEIWHIHITETWMGAYRLEARKRAAHS